MHYSERFHRNDIHIDRDTHTAHAIDDVGNYICDFQTSGMRHILTDDQIKSIIIEIGNQAYKAGFEEARRPALLAIRCELAN